VSDVYEVSKAKESVARIAVFADASFLQPVAGFVTQTGHRLGLRGEAAELPRPRCRSGLP
jgi:hypothetical protein